MTKFPVVGMSHRKPADTIITLLPPETQLYVVREPSNPHDPNAIQVWIKDFAGTFPDSVSDVIDACTGLEIPCPDLSQPFMLGYVKAATIDEETQGADQLAPRLDKMIDTGLLDATESVPFVLVYGASGRPSITIQDELGAEEIDTSDASEDDEEDEVGLEQDNLEQDEQYNANHE